MDNELFSLPGTTQMLEVATRLLTASVLGGLLGAERQLVGKAAGLRTHMLVALGAALFIVAPRAAGVSEGDVGRIIQGVATGIGFIGAGTILKRAHRQEIQGLTTAASIWLTAAVGIAAAVGPIWVPVFAATGAWFILYALGKAENRLSPAPPGEGNSPGSG